MHLQYSNQRAGTHSACWFGILLLKRILYSSLIFSCSVSFRETRKTIGLRIIIPWGFLCSQWAHRQRARPGRWNTFFSQWGLYLLSTHFWGSTNTRLPLLKLILGILLFVDFFFFFNISSWKLHSSNMKAYSTLHRSKQKSEAMLSEILQRQMKYS